MVCCFARRYRVTDDGNAVEVKGDAAEQLDKLLGMLDELEDITDVYHNAKVEYDDEEED
jgi:transcriptional/translational regulatory protein YebC/TACO1